MSIFNKRLKKLRKNKGLTQKELADHIDVVQSKISSWETERLEPNLYRLIQLADYFGVTTDYLLGREEEKS